MIIEYETKVSVIYDFVIIMAHTFNIYAISICKDYNEKLITYDSIAMPRSLSTLDYVSMSSLINEFQSVQDYRSKARINIIFIVLSVVVAI